MAEYALGQVLRVLLVSAREEATQEVREALSGCGANHRVFWVSQPDLAIARAEELVPHVILVDDTLGRSSPVHAIKDLVARIPTVPVLALVSEGSMSLAGQAVLAGARAFVGKPFQGDELLATLRQVVVAPRHNQPKSEAAERTDGRILVFYAAKGGTGRTTLVVNTAVSLAMALKQPVGLVDADYSSPALDVALNLHSQRNISDLQARFSQLDEELISAVMVPHASGIQVLLAPALTVYSDSLSVPQVQGILVLLRRRFPWVVVDLGPPLDERALAFLDTADRIVVSALPDLVSLRNMRQLLDQLQARGYAGDKLCLVLNRATLRGGVSQQDIEARLQTKLNYTIPDDGPLATYSINRGVPFVMSHGRSALGRAVYEMAEQFIADFAVEQTVRSSDGRSKRWLPTPRPASA